MNALAVEIAAREGARIVWMPTVDSADRDRRPRRARSRASTCRSGRASSTSSASRARDRARRGDRRAGDVAPRDAATCCARSRGTGSCSRPAHLGRDEIFAVVDAAFEEGVRARRRHASGVPLPGLLDEDQVALVERGCLLERCFSTPLTRQVHAGSTSSTASARSGPSTTSLDRLRPARDTRRSRTGSRLLPTGCSGRLRRRRDPDDDRRTRLEAGGRMSRRMLVIGAHSADFVWRAGGAIAVTTPAAASPRCVALSYGERGESGELWKERGPDDREREGDPPRRGRARRAAPRRGVRRARLRRLPARHRPRAADPDRRRRSASSSPTSCSPTPTRTRSTPTTRRRSSPSSARGRSPPAPESAARSRSSSRPSCSSSSRISRSSATSRRRRSSTSRR